MLKIKDDVDLQELKKFGFIYDKEMKYYCKNCIGTFNKIIVFDYDSIDTFKGLICMHNESNFSTTLYLDILYDLIKADLVEKVSIKYAKNKR